MRNAEGKKKETIKAIQTTKQSNTTHVPKVVIFIKKNELPGVGFEPMALRMYMYIAE